MVHRLKLLPQLNSGVLSHSTFVLVCEASHVVLFFFVNAHVDADWLPTNSVIADLAKLEVRE